jgi:hypothetical protein
VRHDFCIYHRSINLMRDKLMVLDPQSDVFRNALDLLRHFSQSTDDASTLRRLNRELRQLTLDAPPRVASGSVASAPPTDNARQPTAAATS